MTQSQAVVDLMSTFNISRESAHILLTRGFSLESARLLLFQTGLRRFSESSLRDETAHGLNLIQNAKKVGVFCDYDADGLLSSEVIQEFLSELAIPYTLYIPERIDGYGLQEAGIRKLKSRGADVLLTADCGSNDTQALQLATQLGMKTIVTDHHKFESRPPVDAFLNSMSTEFQSLCGCAVVGFFLRDLSEEIFQRVCPYMAVATIGDLVPLYQESRQLVSDFLEFPEVPGVLEAAFHDTDELSTSAIGFQVVPKFNAFSRLGCVATYLRSRKLLPVQLAELMTATNNTRKKRQKEILKNIKNRIHQEDDILVVNIEEADDSYVGFFGLIASRLTEQYKKPSLVGYVTKDGLFKGSGRSPSWLNLHELLGYIPADSLEEFHYGGHSVALGFSCKSSPEQLRHTLMNVYSLHADKVQSPKTEAFDLQLKSRFLHSLKNVYRELQPFGSQFPPIRVKIPDLNIESLSADSGFFAEVTRGHSTLLIPPLQQRQLLYLQRTPKTVYADLIAETDSKLKYVVQSVVSDRLPADEASLPRSPATRAYTSRKNLGHRRL